MAEIINESAKKVCTTMDFTESDGESVKLEEYKMILNTIRTSEEAMAVLRVNLSKVSQRRILKKRFDRCVNCDTKVELEILKQFITCTGCDLLACQNQQCSEFVHGLDVWECMKCRKNRVVQQKAGEWLLRQLNAIKDPDGNITMSKERVFINSEDQNLAALVAPNQREKVRQFIEELLSNMLNGPLDDVSVGQLFNDDKYIKLFDKNHAKLSQLLLKLENSIHQSLIFGLPLIGPIPSTTTHQELKKFVQSIVEEVLSLPQTLDFSGVPGRVIPPLPYFDPKKYEQLLATAVLNKITDYYQNEQNHENSSGINSDTELDSNHNQVTGKVIDLMVKKKESKLSNDGINPKSLENDELYLSDYVQSHHVPLPDLSTDSANDDAEIQSINSSNGTDATWEDNWLFKKRKLKTEGQQIAMLVPSPTEEMKALIGDTNADETSDLSENSDIEADENPKVSKTFTNTVLITNVGRTSLEKNVTTVQVNMTPSPENQSLLSMQSLTSNQSGGLMTEAKNTLLLMSNQEEQNYQQPTVGVQTINFIINEAVGDHHQKPTSIKTEEEEEFDSIVNPSAVREHKKSIDEEFERLLMDDNNNNTFPDDDQDVKCSEKPSSINEYTSSTTLPRDVKIAPAIDAKSSIATEKAGSIAEREHMKWINAAPMANNPYSTEALQRRLSESDHKTKLMGISNNKLVDKLVEESQGNEGDAENDDEPMENIYEAKQKEIKRYGRDYYINDDASSARKRFSQTSSKSSSFEVADEVSDKNIFLKHNPMQQQDSKIFLIDKLLNSERLGRSSRTSSVESLSRSSRASSEKEFALPKEIMKQLEEKMLHNDLKRESFRARTGTSNFCLNPLFEEDRSSLSNESKEIQKPKETLPQELSHKYSNEDSKSNCVENIFLDLNKSETIVPIACSEKLFRALPVFVSENDSLIILRTEEPTSPKFETSINSQYSPTAPSISTIDDSLTYSEDSDTTRIYNFNTRETQLLNLESTEQEAPLQSPIRIQKLFISPEKFSAKKLRKMDDEVTTVVRTSHPNLNGDNGMVNHVMPMVQEIYEEKQVIEADVIESLPSVKKLAEIYATTPVDNNIPLNKPKTFAFIVEESPQSSSNKSPSVDTYSPNYNNVYHPAAVGHSITARSIPSQVRADLKKSYSLDEAEAIIRHSERESSPEIMAGAARNSIAFFENLKQ
ncbi:unnamed protein product [Diamesa hyperborea]